MRRIVKSLLLCLALNGAGGAANAELGNVAAPAKARLDLFFDSSYLTPAEADSAAAASQLLSAPGSRPNLWASAVLVLDQERNEILLQKNAESVLPIASVTKLMTALVVLGSGQSLDEVLKIKSDDVGYVRHTKSRFGVGQRATRAELLRLMLMASDNRAAMALANNHPGGFERFVAKMNETARAFGMRHTRFVDPVGMSPNNVSRAYDLAILVRLAAQKSLIRKYSTTPELTMASSYKPRKAKARKVKLSFVRNTNALTRSKDWEIDLSKTGYIAKAGHCLVMQARVSERPVTIVILDSFGRNGRLNDARQIKEWLEHRNDQAYAEI